eukprot:g6623.t1
MTPLELAISEKNHAAMTALLAAGADVERKANFALNPLLSACSSNFLEGVKLLIEYGADIGVQSSRGSTCLILAAKRKHLSVVSYLLDQKSCPINKADRKGFTALHYIVLLNDASLTSKIISKGSDINAQNSIAKDQQNTEVLKLLLTLKTADVQTFRTDDTNLIDLAIKKTDFDLMRIVLDQGYNTEQRNEQGWTPLMIACASGFLDGVRLLIEFGADIKATTPDGLTTLLLAVKHRQPQVFCYLLEQDNRPINDTDQDGFTVLHRCVIWDDPGSTLFLISKGADLNAKNKDGETPVFLATKHKHIVPLMVLLKAGADPNVMTNKGDFAINTANNQGQLNIAMLLLNHGTNGASNGKSDQLATEFGLSTAFSYQTNINVQKTVYQESQENDQPSAMETISQVAETAANTADEETVHVAKSAVNNNPLVAACSNGFLEGAALLIEFGVDISAHSVDGFTCLLAAAKNGHLDVVYYLLMNCSCDLHAIGRDGYTTLHHIAVLDSPEIIVKLICNGADVNAQNWNGETAVYLAAKNNSVDSLEVLLHYGADPDIVTEREDGSISGASALHEAVNQNNVEAVKLLLNFGADIAAIRSDGLTPIEVALSLSPPRQEVIDYLFDASTISEQIKKLALRCAYTEQLLQEQKDEVDEKSVRCKDAEAQLVKLQCEMDKCSNRCELAEQTLKGLQSEMEYCVCCPITFTIMEDPVIASDGHTYERRAIEQWLKNKRESPVTRQPLTSSSLIPNLAVKHLIDHYEGKNSGAFDTS